VGQKSQVFLEGKRIECVNVADVAEGIHGLEQASAASAREPSAFQRTVGRVIRQARQTHGWTQATLATRSGLSSNYIARLERGELCPSLYVASKICAALAIALDALVTMPTEPASSSR
jgi:ribosome-binding protein aMBF1 (putative translation factor)